MEDSDTNAKTPAILVRGAAQSEQRIVTVAPAPLKTRKA
jgi:hypothetical protein